VLTTHGFYDRRAGFDSRNVAANNPTTPSPASTFPMTASMSSSLARWQQRGHMLACSTDIFPCGAAVVQQMAALPRVAQSSDSLNDREIL
jgi:hypothetical protein